MKPGPMIQCQKCSADIPAESRFCLSCGQAVSTPSQAPTMEAPDAVTPKAAETPHVARIISSDSIPAGGFTPGTILADRYRIIGLLGRGGMGEVYRADDLKLGQPVALKFLPPRLADDAVRRERFFAEVRITRQLSHPNICRVYDIQEFEGRHFLSMEFIDGEDLASLIRRIGHLSNEKALDIARQLAAGLAAAHERGVLHRDLKLANIMLDGHGRVRITDFGLAIAVEDEAQATEIAGTPAYMAPEQLAGKGATVRSDMYSLGLVLYEIYTGKKAFAATNLAELRQQKETHTPRAISELREGMDPVVERLIRSCMEKDPNARPASVAQLALALPGGDPLAAALAAGETPSPEMVAASGSKEGLRPAIAWGLLAFIIIGTLGLIWMKDSVMLYRRIPFNNSPEALADRSKLFLTRAGYAEKFEDSAYGFIRNSEYLSYIEISGKSPNRWKNLDARAILFWYRQSPRPIQVLLGTIAPDNPPLQHPGEVLLVLDTEGRLQSLRALPREAQPRNSAAPMDWAPFFREAGLELSQWTPVDPQSLPLSYADSRAAWSGSLPSLPDARVRIEAAAFQGKPVRFEFIFPKTDAAAIAPARMRALTYSIALTLLFVTATLGGVFFARRNLRLGRGDRRNANRLSLFVLCLSVVSWILTASHSSPVDLLLIPYLAALTWIFYMAIEPFVRRRWPHILVSSTRLLSGEWKDALVAREALIGSALGILASCMLILSNHLVPSWFGYEELRPPQSASSLLENIVGARFLVSGLIGSVLTVILLCLSVLCLLFIMRVLLRSQIAAIIVCVLFWAFLQAPGSLWSFLVGIVLTPIFFIALTRFGLLAAVHSLLANLVISAQFPTTLDASAWYAGYGYAALAIFAAIVLYAFRTSLGGRPIFGTPRLDE